MRSTAAKSRSDSFSIRNRRAFVISVIAVITVFGILLLWPGLVLDTYVRIAVPSRNTTTQTASESQNILASIDFALPSTTESIDSAVAPDETADNHLIIPSIGVNGEVIISNSQSALNRGFWHIPGSALPGQKGNIVISSHRWLHKPPNPVTFYRIDEIRIGDPIYYNFGKKRYTYTVTNTNIVSPTEVSILEQNEDKLTLFTCHPLFSTAQRYVVLARLVSVDDIPAKQ